MKALAPAIFIGLGIALLWLVPVLLRRRTEARRTRESPSQVEPDFVLESTGFWPLFHKRLVGAAICFYGVYLATLTGTVTKLFLPFIGAVGGGAVGFGAVRGFGFKAITHPLVSPWIWVPVIALGFFLLLGTITKGRLATVVRKQISRR